jgi:hypothetical protein
MRLDVLSDPHTAVVDAMEQGQSFELFKKNIKPLLQLLFSPLLFLICARPSRPG